MLNKLINWIRKNWRHIIPPPEVKRGKAWNAIEGDLTLRLQYDQLDAHSLVIDLGGFKGQFAGDIYAKYNCRVMVFEPVIKFFEIIRERFKNNAKITAFPYGLGNGNHSVYINLEGDKTSLYKSNAQKEEVRIVDFLEFLEAQKIQKIDLLKINIEGAEYEVLAYLIKTGKISKIENIQVQFHDFVPDAENKMKAIQDDLAKTHRPTYSFPFVWENWELKH